MSRLSNLILLGVATMVLLCGCTSDLPQLDEGSSISGVIRYDGEAHLSYAEPAIIVSAMVSFPPGGPPHSSVTIRNPDFSGDGIPYTLKHLKPYNYFVVAQLVDLQAEAVGLGPTGGAPNTCALTEPTGGVAVGDHEALTADITMYDGGGGDDPCNVPNDSVCPDPGAASLILNVSTGVEDSALLGDSDIIIIGLFTTWPPTGLPAAFDARPRDAIEADMRFVVTTVPPGDYVAYACLDVGGNNLMTGCGDEDQWTVLEMPQTFAVDAVVEVDLDLVAKNGAVVDVGTRADHMCDATPMMASLTVNVDALGLEPDSGGADAVVVSLYDAFPATGAPLVTATEPVTTFPTRVQLEGLAPGPVFVAVCFDSGGDDTGACNGAGDVLQYFADGQSPVVLDNNVPASADVLLVGGSSAPLSATVESSLIVPAAGDQLTVSLFADFPVMGAPSHFVSADVTSFPTVVELPDAPNGDWYVSVCYDAGGDNVACDGPGDLVTFFMNGAGTVTVDGTPTQLSFDLDAIPGTIEVTLESAALMPMMGDTAGLSIFDSWPPVIPSGFVSNPVSSFPATLTIEGVAPGEWYLVGCYDAGGDTLTCDGPGDAAKVYMDAMAPLVVGPGEVVQLNLSLD